MKRGKKYQDAAKLVEKTKAYDTEEAVELAMVPVDIVERLLELGRMGRAESGEKGLSYPRT